MTSAPNDREPQHARFLRVWFLGCPMGELIEVRPLHKRPDRPPTRREWHGDAASAAAHVARALKNHDDVYVGALGRVGRGGTEHDVGARRWVWSDVDYGATGHAKPAPYATRGEALAAIERVAGQLGAAPTFLVDTGGGFHAWWALAEPAADGPWRDAIARLAHALGGDTNAIDPPRILRIPGTKNFKTEPPRRVQLVACSECHVALARVLALPAAPAPAAPAPKRARPAGEPEGPFDLANDVPIAEVFEWLGVAMHREGRRVYCACPVHRGSNTSQMVVGGDANGAHCFGDCNRFFTNVDVVAAVKGVDPRAAVELLAERFNFQGFKGRVYPGGARAMPAADPHAPWDEPVPLGRPAPPLFPAGVLEGAVGRFAEELAHASQTPPDMPSMLALAAVSAAAARKFAVRLHYVEPINVYVAVALPPGSRKSEVFRWIVAPFDDVQRADLDRRRAEKAAGVEDETPPLRYYGDDATPEALASKLAEQGGRFAVLSAEGGGLFDQFNGKYQDKGRGPNLQVYLAGHAGDPIIVDRVKRASEVIYHPALTIGVATQPGTLQTLAARDELRARGLVARFLFAVPRSNIGSRLIEPPPVSDEARAEYHRVVRRLLALPDLVDDDGHHQARRLVLDEGARDVYRAFAGRVEARQRPGQDLAEPALAEWASKYAGAVVRLAGLLHVAAHALDEDPAAFPIAGETFERAVYLGEHYLVPHARIAFDVMTDTAAVETARRLLDWLRRTKLRQFSVRDAQRALGGKGSREHTVDPAIDVLLTHGYIRVAVTDEPDGRGRGGRPKGIVFDVHPSL